MNEEERQEMQKYMSKEQHKLRIPRNVMIFGVLIMVIVGLSAYIVQTDVAFQHETALEESYMQGRYDTLFLLGQQLQQKGSATVSVPIYNVETNLTEIFNVELRMVQNEQ